LRDVIWDSNCGSYGLVFKNLFGVPLVSIEGKIEFMKRLRYMRDVVRGLDYIHKKRIIHKDLKHGNILITGKGAKIFDFGLSKIMESEPLVTRRSGTKCYHSP
jgi:serine/threonine protein kinase